MTLVGGCTLLTLTMMQYSKSTFEGQATADGQTETTTRDQ